MSLPQIKLALVICMVDSIHFARWLEQFGEQGIDFLLFPISPNRRIHPQLKALLERNTTGNYEIALLGKWFGLPLRILDKFTNNFFGQPCFAGQTGSTNQTSCKILSFRMPVMRASGHLQNTNLKDSASLPQTGAVTSSGFKDSPSTGKLEALLKLAGAYSAECHWDVALSRELGFTGEALPVIPNAGGFSKADLSLPLLQPDKRKTIALKGCHGWAGRAKVSLEAVREVAEELGRYQFVVYSANRSVIKLAMQVAKKTGLDSTAHAKRSLSHQKVLKLFAKSKIYVGLSESYGISTTILKAMAMAAIPVQTSTACCDEWFKDSGVEVTEISVDAVKSAIRQGLALAEDPTNTQVNLKAIELWANAEEAQKTALTYYGL